MASEHGCAGLHGEHSGEEMKRMIMLGAAALAAVGGMPASSAPYEDQKVQIQRLQDSRLRGAPAASGAPQGMSGMHGMSAMHGTPGTSGMPGQMQLMQEMDRQMQQARDVDRMSPQQMRDWIVEHTQLMDRMQEQMQMQPRQHGPMDGNRMPHEKR
jgi:hypothetical protein